jgi:hypothetical protein
LHVDRDAAFPGKVTPNRSWGAWSAFCCDDDHGNPPSPSAAETLEQRRVEALVDLGRFKAPSDIP